MKRFFYCLLLTIFAAAAVSCSKDDTQGDGSSTYNGVKVGVWTNWPDRNGDTTGNVKPLIMRVSKGGVHFSQFDIAEGKLDYVDGEISFDGKSDSGSVTFPKVADVEGVATFTLNETKDRMTCVTAKKDTVNLAYCGESTEGWWNKVNIEKLDGIKPTFGNAVHYDFADTMAELASKVTGIPATPLNAPQTKNNKHLDRLMGVGAVCDVLTTCMSVVSFALSVSGPSISDVMDKCNEIYAICDEMNQKLDEALVKLDETLEKIGDVEQEELVNGYSNCINARNSAIHSVNYDFSGRLGLLEELEATPVASGDSTDYWKAMIYGKNDSGEFNTERKGQLALWAGDNDEAIFKTLYPLMDLLMTESCAGSKPGSMLIGMPYIYDQLMMQLTAWEHEGDLAAELLRMQDLATVVLSAHWAVMYLDACKYLGILTNSGRSPITTTVGKQQYPGLIEELDAKCNRFGKFYENADIDIEEHLGRRICYIRGAHFIIEDLMMHRFPANECEITYGDFKYQCVDPKDNRKEHIGTWQVYSALSSNKHQDFQVFAHNNLITNEAFHALDDYYSSIGKNIHKVSTFFDVAQLESHDPWNGYTYEYLVYEEYAIFRHFSEKYLASDGYLFNGEYLWGLNAGKVLIYTDEKPLKSGTKMDLADPDERGYSPHYVKAQSY